MGSTKNFFLKKKLWSLLKDKVIDNYLSPYISKILSTQKPLAIIDCFAGKGRFDSGEDGSPLIIAKHIKSVLEKDRIKNKNISGIFIEKKYVYDLKKILSTYRKCKVLMGTFEGNIKKILSLNSDNNVFMYVDPYGPKSLPFKPFQQIRSNEFASLEVLMNFNTFGFLREGCRALKYYTTLSEIEEEGEDFYEIDESSDLIDMDKIANGDYWRDILEDYTNGKIDMFQSEEYFVNEYINQIKSMFEYVVNIPIKLKTKNVPKYRLIFGTNHEDGLILMADMMNKVWKKILEQDRNGQGVLFDIEFPDLSLLKEFNLEKEVLSMIRNCKSELPMKKLIVNLIEKYGISYSGKEYSDKFKKLEEGKKIEIVREPRFTQTGKLATSLDYSKYKIILRIK